MIGGKANDLKSNYLYLVQCHTNNGVWTFEITINEYTSPNKSEVWRKKQPLANVIKFGFGNSPDSAVWTETIKTKK
jgi:hypothetical protein